MGEINKVKAWFFYEEFKSSKRRWYKGYDVMISAGGHMTCGATLAETIYMAHDLIACITDDIVEGRIGVEWLADWKQEAAELHIPETAYVGTMDIGVDILPGGGWVRRDDPIPRTRQPFRIRALKKAFEMTYKNFRLKKEVSME